MNPTSVLGGPRPYRAQPNWQVSVSFLTVCLIVHIFRATVSQVAPQHPPKLMKLGSLHFPRATVSQFIARNLRTPIQKMSLFRRSCNCIAVRELQPCKTNVFSVICTMSQMAPWSAWGGRGLTAALPCHGSGRGGGLWEKLDHEGLPNSPCLT